MVSSEKGIRVQAEHRDNSYGEIVSIAERIVVSPAWGRLHVEPLTEGQLLEKGAVIGRLREAGREIPLVCHAEAIFLAWLADEGERVPPGRRVARLRLAGA